MEINQAMSEIRRRKKKQDLNDRVHCAPRSVNCIETGGLDGKGKGVQRKERKGRKLEALIVPCQICSEISVSSMAVHVK